MQTDVCADHWLRRRVPLGRDKMILWSMAICKTRGAALRACAGLRERLPLRGASGPFAARARDSSLSEGPRGLGLQFGAPRPAVVRRSARSLADRRQAGAERRR